MLQLGSLSRSVIRMATAEGLVVGTAESLTAGMIAATLADVPGASRVLMGGVVSYDTRIKRELLGVSPEVVEESGVVSAPCACQMAEGARARLKVDVAVSATGLAGPGGGTPQTPVGTVFIGVASAKGVRAERFIFTGNRRRVRRKATQAALRMLLEELKVETE